MENNFNSGFTNDIAPLPEKPQFLKVLCILSFVACGLMIIFTAIGSMALGMNETTQNDLWNIVLQSQPQLENIDPQAFFQAFGMMCVYTLIANIFSLTGVIFMWRLNKVGFFIYATAELAVHFFGVKIAGADDSNSTASMAFGILIDSIFIILYAVNLKHMRKQEAA